MKIPPPEIDELTPEYVMQVGREWIDAVLNATPAEEVMRHYSPAERMAGLEPEELLSALDEDQIRRYLAQLENAKPKK